MHTTVSMHCAPRLWAGQQPTGDRQWCSIDGCCCSDSLYTSATARQGAAALLPVLTAAAGAPSHAGTPWTAGEGVKQTKRWGWGGIARRLSSTTVAQWVVIKSLCCLPAHLILLGQRVLLPGHTVHSKVVFFHCKCNTASASSHTQAVLIDWAPTCFFLASGYSAGSVPPTCTTLVAFSSTCTGCMRWAGWLASAKNPGHACHAR